MIRQVVTSSSRSDNCSLKLESTKKIDKKWRKLQRYFKKKNDEKRYGRKLKRKYHATGHMVIGEDCKNKPDDFDGPMVYDAISARDPTFYR